MERTKKGIANSMMGGNSGTTFNLSYQNTKTIIKRPIGFYLSSKFKVDGKSFRPKRLFHQFYI
jgi:hypothetical protein